MFINDTKSAPYKKQLKTAYYILSKNPLINITVWHLWINQHTGKIFSETFRRKKVYFIFLLWWSTESISMVSRIKYILSKHKNKYPEHNFFFLCNSKREYKLFRKFDIPCIFCNNSALIDEKIFTIMLREKKKYDAVYNAQMAWLKRHTLASKIDNLALITYFDGVKSSNFCYIITKKFLSNAAWLNQPCSSKDNGYLNPAAVTRYLNQARVGLCLSAVEGTMYASIEYLLCGLPVVSTESTGGRDIFFDKEYVKIVDNSKIAVKKGVDEMIKRNISPNYIRKKTLKKMKPHRERFINLIQKIYTKEGINRKFKDEWNKVFINKMLIWQDINLVKNYIRK